MGFDLLSRFMFPAPPSSYNVDSYPGELCWIPETLNPQTATPEASIPCIFLPYSSARFVVIYLHSNAEDIGRAYPFCNNLRAQFQVHVLVVEYPGYGLCPGGPCNENRATDAARTAVRFVLEVLEVPLDSIILLGRSIGSGIAISLGTDFDFAGIIAVSPIISVREICKEVVGSLASVALADHFPNKERVAALKCPCLFVHGQSDKIVPVRHGKELYESCRTRKLFVCPQEMEHNTNLLSDISYLVVPMLHFFSLPDYCFEDLCVPQWIFNKRLCPQFRAQTDHGWRQKKSNEAMEWSLFGHRHHHHHHRQGFVIGDCRGGRGPWCTADRRDPAEAATDSRKVCDPDDDQEDAPPF